MNQALRSAAMELAAVSGAFEPAALARALGVEDARPHRDALWRTFGSDVTEVLPGGKAEDGPVYGWLLKPDLRRAWLAQFVSRTQLDRALAEAPLAWPVDLFGQMLRTLLTGRRVNVAECSADDTDADIVAALRHNAAILDAVQFARVVPVLDRKALATVEALAKHRIQSLQRRRDLTVVLPRRHHGYAGARRRLSAHLRGSTANGRPLLLTGPGGVGKSAVLARLLRHWQRRHAAPVILILDFDRRQLNGGEPVEILKEFLRQLESGIAGKLENVDTERKVARELNAMRHAMPKLTATGEQRSDTSQLGFLASWLAVPFSADWAEPVRTRPIAVVFDSFEAIDRRGGAVVETIFELEALLRELLPNLRTVVSGRAEPLDEAQIKYYFGPAQRRLELRGLDPEAGAKLLADEDARLAGDGSLLLPGKAGRERVSRILGGHPLALLIFAQYAHSYPGDVDRLVEDLDTDEGFRAEFAQVFLYERILDRIDRPDLKKLAHPGLVLRQLSPDLIRFVLAGPCLGEGADGPRPMSPERADALHAELRDEYWLVEPGDPPFGLRHRPDLRRLMLPGIFAGPRPEDSAAMAAEKRDLHDRAIAVCAAAARYFAEGPPASEVAAQDRWEAIDDRIRRINALYYLAFCRPDAPEPFDGATAAELDQDIGEDVDTMPLAWRARINVLVGRTPTPEEMAVLSLDLSEQGEERIFAQQKQHGLGADFGPEAVRPIFEPKKSDTLDADEFGHLLEQSFGVAGSENAKAVASFARDAGSEQGRTTTAYERDIQRAFAAARFDAIPALATDYFDALVRRPDEETARRFREAETEGYWRHPLWLCLLVAGAGIGDAEMAAAAQVQRTEESPYAPVYAAIIAAAEGRHDDVARALQPIFERDILSPVDFNRTRGGQMARWLAEDGKAELDLFPNALCLFAGWSDRHDKLTSPLGHFLYGNGALLAVRMEGARGLDLISKAYEHPRAQGKAHLEPASWIDAEEEGVVRAILRGLNPDLQMPLAPRLQRMVKGDVVALADRMHDRARYWPAELSFGGKRRFRSAQGTTVVETADQCGLLRGLTSAACAIDPDLTPLLAMYDCISRWFFPFLDVDASEAA